MERVALGQWFDRNPEVNAPALSNILGRLEVGFNTDLRAPILESLDYAEAAAILQSYVGPAPYAALSTLDDEERSKMGTRSVILPWEERKGNLEAYWGSASELRDADYELLNSSGIFLCGIGPTRALRPISLNQSFERSVKGSNLGLPLLTSDPESAQPYLERARTLLLEPDFEPEEGFYPYVPFTRGQASGGPVAKARFVWGADHAESYLAGMFTPVVLDMLRNQKGFSAWSNLDVVDQAVSSILRRPGVKYSIDFSGFDSSLPSAVTTEVFFCIASWFQLPYVAILSSLHSSFIGLGMVTPEGLWDGRDGGVPSGSGFTNLVDSLANLFVMRYASARLGTSLLDYEVMGDDGVYRIKGDPDLSELADVLQEVGMTLNTEKTMTSESEVHYLQRLHSREYEARGLYPGVRSPYRTLNGMLTYERLRQDWNEYYDTARWIMQVENSRNDPRFAELVRFLFDHDKVLQDVDALSALRQVSSSTRILRDKVGVDPLRQEVESDVGTLKTMDTVAALRELKAAS